MEAHRRWQANPSLSSTMGTVTASGPIKVFTRCQRPPYNETIDTADTYNQSK